MNESEFVDLIFDTINDSHGKLSIDEYKTIVLNLIFLKYLSDEFEKRYQELLDEGEGFEDDIDEYISENIFYIPPEARWELISKKTYSEENGYTIDNAMRLIEKSIPISKIKELKIFEEYIKLKLNIGNKDEDLDKFKEFNKKVKNELRKLENEYEPHI